MRPLPDTREPSGLHSTFVLPRFRYRAPDPAFRSDEVDAAPQRTLAALAKSHGVKIR